ncbi:glycosyltransferase [Sinimarinibacterium sp. CAU 1509]|uniref:glycosyltransferase n=1 Tax=Sinimarinibacterium sp. CAU 1509 TaxID=2562283 RepID=UPI0010AD04C9|nr:glycosyltransferase [Sinimarinibacterium sp. CAU 1509]TJY59327.1 glycosyltransferase [Sinimarinibacterium sp. CAU 1509]
MKILHVETGMHLYGGAQQVAYLLDGLVRRRVQCVLVCPPGAAIGRHFAGSAVQVEEIPCSGDLDLGFIGRLRRAIERHRPDLVHLHSRRGADVLGGIAAKRAGVPAVLSRRVDNPEKPWWARWKYRRYARVICISEGIADVLRSEGVEAARIAVVRSAVDAAPWTHPQPRASFLGSFGVPPNSLVAGVVAQLIKRKGHHLLLQALHQLIEHHQLMPGALTVLCFGQGPERAALEQQAASLHLSDCVRFVGFRDDLPRWMGNLDFLIHPALMEGLGVSLLQASSAGVPVIASRAGGMPEAVRDGENGMLVPPGDVDALARAIRTLISDTGLRRRLSDGGRALIAREFSVGTMVEGNLQIYRALLDSGTRA